MVGATRRWQTRKRKSLRRLPDLIQEGDAETKIGLKHYPKSPLTEKFCAVVYREVSERDGFVVTSYFCSRYAEKRRILWKR